MNKSAHIIIEGPDGTGKTTLAQTLCDQAGYAYRHEGPPPAGVTAFQHYAGILASLREPTLLDRFHLGELVYGPLLRGRSGLDANDMGRLRVQLAALHVQTIICLPPVQVALNNWLERSRRGKELFSDPVLFARTYLAFYDLKHEADVVYDYTRGVLDIDSLATRRRRPRAA